jgi:phosphoglycerate dehydrogenase-like enzyme
MTWKPPEQLACYPNLEVVFCIGAGVDQFANVKLPSRVRLIRMVDQSITRMVVEYAVMAVLSLHRNLHVYIDQQRRHVWHEVMPQPQCADRRVSVRGLGVLGEASLVRDVPVRIKPSLLGESDALVVDIGMPAVPVACLNARAKWATLMQATAARSATENSSSR